MSFNSNLIYTIEIPAPTTVMTTDAFANRSYSKVHHKKLDNQVLGDYGVGEWRDGTGKIVIHMYINLFYNYLNDITKMSD